jgi:hypothetical protein
LLHIPLSGCIQLNCLSLCLKVWSAQVQAPTQSDLDVDPPSSPLPPLDVPAEVRCTLATTPVASGDTVELDCPFRTGSPPRAAPNWSGVRPLPTCGEGTSNPLHPPENIASRHELELTSAIPVIMACIDMSVAIMHMYTTTIEASRAQHAYKKRKKKMG